LCRGQRQKKLSKDKCKGKIFQGGGGGKTGGTEPARNGNAKLKSGRTKNQTNGSSLKKNVQREKNGKKGLYAR